MKTFSNDLRGLIIREIVASKEIPMILDKLHAELFRMHFYLVVLADPAAFRRSCPPGLLLRLFI